MTVTTTSPTLVTTTEAQAFLRSKGYSDGNADVLQILLNGVHAELYRYAGRKRILDDGTTMTEYLDGDGTRTILTRERPITSVVQVVLEPHVASSTVTLTGPGALPANDSMIVNMPLGEIELLDYVFPCGIQTVQVDYKAGGTATDHEVLHAKQAVLELLAMRWQANIEKQSAIKSRKAGEQSWDFRPLEELDREATRIMRPFRKRWVV